jgi:ribosomal silencing factor RsfS
MIFQNVVVQHLQQQGAERCVTMVMPACRSPSHVVVVTALNTRHLDALVTTLTHTMRTHCFQKPTHLDIGSDWSVMCYDNIDLWVHVLLQPIRQLYDLETLWQTWGASYA